MSRRNLRKSVAALTLAGALALPLPHPAAAAGAPRTQSRPAPAASLWEQAWEWVKVLTGVASPGPSADAGGCVDPNGKCEH
jgi:hypothetical protein